MATWLLLLAGACATSVADSDGAELATEVGYELDLADSTAVWLIPREVPAARLKPFVQVEITDVHNPGLVPLSFAVRFRGDDGLITQLGVFALFPPDNPGTFIVATRDNAEPGGAVLVTLEPLDGVTEADEVRVRIDRIALTRGPNVRTPR